MECQASYVLGFYEIRLFNARFKFDQIAKTMTGVKKWFTCFDCHEYAE